MRYKIYSLIERALSALSAFFLRASERFAICEHCGLNRYTGEPCGGVKP